MRKFSHGQNSNLWLENILFELRAKKIVNSLRSINQLEIVADFGCGYRGKLLKKIVNIFSGVKSAVGLDLSVNAITPEQKIKLIKTDINSPLPLADNSFDAVICSAVIEHLSNYRQALTEIHRLLKNGGYLILTSPAPQAKNILEFLAFKLNLLSQAEIADHKKYFSAQELKKILQELSFSEIKIKTFQFGFNNLYICKK